MGWLLFKYMRVHACVYMICLATSSVQATSCIPLVHCKCTTHPHIPQVLTYTETMQVWRSMYFVGHIIMLSIVAAGSILPAPKNKKKHAQGTNGKYMNGDQGGVDITPISASGGQKED